MPSDILINVSLAMDRAAELLAFALSAFYLSSPPMGNRSPSYVN